MNFFVVRQSQKRQRAQRRLNHLAIQHLYRSGDTLDELLTTVNWEHLGADLLRVYPIKEEDAETTLQNLLYISWEAPGENPDPVEMLRKVKDAPRANQRQKAYEVLRRILKV